MKMQEAHPELASKKNRASLESMLAADRERGYALSFSGFEPGIDSCAAPVFDALGRAIAAISVTGPEIRFTENPSFRQQTEKRVKDAAHRLSQLMGYISNPTARGPRS